MRGHLILVCLFVATRSTFPVEGAPRSGSRTREVDERQTGEYNVRLNLKDFQIIAVLGGKSQDVGDDAYDYEYELPEDYLDPPTYTTPKNNNSSPQTSTPKTTSTTPKSKTSTTTTTKPHTTQKPKTTTKPSTTTTKTTSPKSTTELVTPPVHQIPVIVMQEGPINIDYIDAKKGDLATASVAIVPNEDFGDNHSDRPVVLGQILQYKRCANGLSRDKRGRCRKYRRPHHSFNIARFASNLASRLKKPEEDR